MYSNRMCIVTNIGNKITKKECSESVFDDDINFEDEYDSTLSEEQNMINQRKRNDAIRHKLEYYYTNHGLNLKKEELPKFQTIVPVLKHCLCAGVKHVLLGYNGFVPNDHFIWMYENNKIGHFYNALKHVDYIQSLRWKC